MARKSGGKPKAQQKDLSCQLRCIAHKEAVKNRAVKKYLVTFLRQSANDLVFYVNFFTEKETPCLSVHLKVREQLVKVSSLLPRADKETGPRSSAWCKHLRPP